MPQQEANLYLAFLIECQNLSTPTSHILTHLSEYANFNFVGLPCILYFADMLFHTQNSTERQLLQQLIQLKYVYNQTPENANVNEILEISKYFLQQIIGEVQYYIESVS